MSLSFDPCDDLSCHAARLSSLCSHAAADLCRLGQARRGYTRALDNIADLPALPERLRQLAFALLDAAGWPPESSEEQGVRSEEKKYDWDEECAEERYCLSQNGELP